MMILMKGTNNFAVDCALFFPASGSSPSRVARSYRADFVRHVAAGDGASQQSSPPRHIESNTPAKLNTAEHAAVRILVSSPPAPCKGQPHPVYQEAQEEGASTHTQAWTGCCRVSSQLARPHTSVTNALQVSFSETLVPITPKQNTKEMQSEALPVHKLAKQTAHEEQREGKMPPSSPKPVTQTTSMTVLNEHKAMFDSTKLTKP